jgi:hypothetical protein
METVDKHREHTFAATATGREAEASAELTDRDLEAIAAGGGGEPAAARHTVLRGGKYTVVK